MQQGQIFNFQKTNKKRGEWKKINTESQNFKKKIQKPKSVKKKLNNCSSNSKLSKL